MVICSLYVTALTTGFSQNQISGLKQNQVVPDCLFLLIITVFIIYLVLTVNIETVANVKYSPVKLLYTYIHIKQNDVCKFNFIMPKSKYTYIGSDSLTYAHSDGRRDIIIKW